MDGGASEVDGGDSASEVLANGGGWCAGTVGAGECGPEAETDVDGLDDSALE